jgi:hypothetical protein
MKRQKVEWYEHHGKSVAVFTARKGMHRKHCLCFLCKKFFPNTEKNCPIAQATYENCVQFSITTPVYECPDFDNIYGVKNEQNNVETSQPVV